MSEPKDDGGPAFPRPYVHDCDSAPDAPYKVAQQGMTLRDWFAGQAMANPDNTDLLDDPGERAEYCYAIANAMIAARKENP